jgi:predicted ABC-class ATPase
MNKCLEETSTLLATTKMTDEEMKIYRRRQRNNESVKRYKLNEKKQIQEYKIKLIQYKQEYEVLTQRYNKLKIELNLLRELFIKQRQTMSRKNLNLFLNLSSKNYNLTTKVFTQID